MKILTLHLGTLIISFFLKFITKEITRLQNNYFLTVLSSLFDSWWLTMTSLPHPLPIVNKSNIAIPSSTYFALANFSFGAIDIKEK